MSRTLVMGVLNVTPDSFSDGGKWADPADAVHHAREMIEQGADLIDIGGESTRPGASRPSAAEELRRVVGVIEDLAGTVPLSVDTMRAEVARAAIEAGATIINDVSGGLADPGMLPLVADAGVDYICQHWRGFGDVMNDNAHYEDPVGEVAQELRERADAAIRAGIDPERLIVDPGLGFAKEADHDWAILGNLHVFNELGYRVLIGASRKRFLGSLLEGREATGRDAATAAVSAWCQANNIWAVRTHEIIAQRDAIAVFARLSQTIR